MFRKLSRVAGGAIRTGLTLGGIAGVALGVTLSDVETANASANAKMMPGLGCVQYGSEGSLWYSADGSVFNNSSTEALTVLCPAVLDFDASIGATGTEIFYRDAHPNESITCEVSARDADGDETWSFWGFSAFNGDHYLSIDSSETGGPSTITDGDIVFAMCVIPPKVGSTGRSKIRGFLYQETW